MKGMMKTHSLLISTFLLMSTLVFSQEITRAKILGEKREVKSQNLKPFRSNFTQRALLQIETGAGFNVKSFYPFLGAVSPGAGFTPGVRFWKPHIFGSRLDFQTSAAYSTKSYQLDQLQIGTILQKGPEPFVGFGGTGGLSAFRASHKRSSKIFLYGDVRYFDFPQEDFYGLGPGSKKSSRTDYALNESSFDGVFGYQFERYMVASLRAGYIRTDTRPGTDGRFPNTETIFGPMQAPGLFNQPDYLHLTATVFLDYRDNPGHPHSGGMYGFAFTRFDDVDQGKFQFNRYTIDLRQYISLGSPQRTVAGRFLTILNQADSGSLVPFYLLDYLGGTESLRGFNEFRFRDNNLVYLSAEYRWEGTHALEFAFFFDAGKVFPNSSDFSFSNLETSPGFGVRLKTPDSTLVRFDIAHSNEGTRFVFKFGASF